MNNGKICIPVCAATAAAVLDQIRRAEVLADLVEIRFDCLDEAEIDPLLVELANHSFSKPFLATYRSPEQGGANNVTLGDRAAFWQRVGPAGFWAIDLEEDMLPSAPASANIIASFHDFTGERVDAAVVFTRLGASGSPIVKIAATARDITDAIPIWSLINQAQSTGKEVIPVAMGEAGKWTRILGPAHGAFLTYASLESGAETAGGQITAADMIEVYRVQDLTPDTKVFGVIGDPVSSSLSPYMHNAAFAAAGVGAVFIHLQAKDLDAFMRRMILQGSREVDLNFGGFSVTMPHKLAVMQYLDEIDETARQIGAVNTVKIADGRLIGYNTDAHGFITPLKARFGDLRGSRVALFGAGGAARACVYALKTEGADLTVFVRDVSKAGQFGDAFQTGIKSIADFRSQSFDVVINATPIGMKSQLADKTLLTADDLSGVKLVYDLVTRMDETPLLREARVAGVPAIGGLEMLIAQGARQFEIWTGQTPPTDIMRGAVEKRMKA